MPTFADKVIQFNQQLSFNKKLPDGIQIMNPFEGNTEILTIAKTFYHKFYNDNRPRKFIIGINPGRLGAGVTGIPFTDTKRLASICNIKIDSFSTHEPSSVFVYDVIEKYYKQTFCSSAYMLTATPFVRLVLRSLIKTESR